MRPSGVEGCRLSPVGERYSDPEEFRIEILRSGSLPPDVKVERIDEVPAEPVPDLDVELEPLGRPLRLRSRSRP
jgi:hypothetical protein